MTAKSSPSLPYHLSFLATVERNQLRLSRAFLVALYLVHYLTPLNTLTARFIHLQYALDSSPITYDLGPSDTYVVIHYVILLTFLRLFSMQCCFGPLASKFCKMTSTKARVRFEEQSWSFVYYTFAFTYGAILYYNLEYFLDRDHMFSGWPHDQMLYAFKCYYLMQIAFWIQQVFVLNVEKPRKDHYQMFSHHIITCLLLLGLYYYYFMRVGHCILMIMDSVDIILAAAKMLKYTGFATACDAMFFLFLVAWVVMRHGVYNLVFYHVWHHLRLLLHDSNCNSPIHPSKRCWTDSVINTFLGLLGGLQIITLVWMYLICKVAYKVVTGKGGAEDVRSDGEDSDVDDNTDKTLQQPKTKRRRCSDKRTEEKASRVRDEAQPESDLAQCCSDNTDSCDTASTDEKTI